MLRQFPNLFFPTFGLCQIKELLKQAKRPRSDRSVNHGTEKNDMSDSYFAGPPDDRKLQPRLEDLLQDRAYLAAFRSHLRSEFSEENIEFWLTCEKFRATASRENLSWKARGIYEEFVRPAASKEINVDQRIREEIKKSLDQPNPRCFDEAQKHVYLLMERDSCPRFLQSDAYLSLKQKSRTLWYF
ncbi:regulator of G-protein signaling 21-like isoform X2 [Hippocampus comes]|uniref:regulator of G-protein signaling 21-like isoform X2 n=1 Tax=Hippocampus comes TaxID=109280 RepID=UPI00094E0026|nr:PREDICTED: regulator of G-protein signaling 21-like isoform X2 [Hippocampus comes]